MALDEHKEKDKEIQVGDFTFLMEDWLTEEFAKFTIDYSDDWLKRGFTIIPDGVIGSC